MDDNSHSKSDNIGTQRLYLNVNPRVVSTFYTRDATVSQLLHNKPNVDELMANLAPAEMDLIHFAPLILQKLCNALLTKREMLSGTTSKQWPASRGSPSKVLPTPTRSDLPRRSPVRPARRRHLRYDPDEGRKGHVLLCILPGRL